MDNGNILAEATKIALEDFLNRDLNSSGIVLNSSDVVVDDTQTTDLIQSGITRNRGIPHTRYVKIQNGGHIPRSR